MSSARLFRWSDHTLLEERNDADAQPALDAADSLLVEDGQAFALELHRERFQRAVAASSHAGGRLDSHEVDAFWHAAFAVIPAHGRWFPRLELQLTASGCRLALRLRPAPELTTSVALLTHEGPDPRQVPTVKGPDIPRLDAARHAAREHGADDIAFVTGEDHLIDGAANALVWWRGETLCAPPPDTDDQTFARVASVTAASVLTLATALGLGTRSERATPAELEGCEVWALNALHGIRIVTHWIDGPAMAQQPGRLAAWRQRRHALRAPTGGAAR